MDVFIFLLLFLAGGGRNPLKGGVLTFGANDAQAQLILKRLESEGTISEMSHDGKTLVVTWTPGDENAIVRATRLRRKYPA